MTTHISLRNREKTRGLIVAKLEILELWAVTEIPWLKNDSGDYVRDSAGERILDYIPIREVHFASWNGTQNCTATRVEFSSLADIKSSRRSTLAETYHQDLQIRLVSVLRLLRAKAQEQYLAATKASVIAKLESNSTYWESLARKQEGEIVALRERMRATEVSLRAMTKAMNHNVDEHQRIVDKLNSKVASLTDLLSKVTPLK